MTKLSVSHAIQLAVEAHRAGRLSEADKYYTAILSVEPEHADANHNLGLIAVELGKIAEAEPHLKIALKVSQNVEQYWVSYVEVLIKLKRFDEALNVLRRAQKRGVFSQKLSLLERSIQRVLNGNFYDIDPPHDKLSAISNKFHQNLFGEVLRDCKVLLTQFPNSPTLQNFMGIASTELGMFSAAIQYFEKAVQLFPKYSNAYNNLGVAWQNLGHYSKAAAAFHSAINLNPEAASPHNNFGNMLLEEGNLEPAINAYLRAVNLQPNNFDACKNLFALSVQLMPDINLDNSLYSQIDKVCEDVLMRGAESEIQSAIRSFIAGEYDLTTHWLTKFEKSRASGELPDKDRVFCNAYYNLLNALLHEIPATESEFADEVIYHIGESHCLSFAGHFLKIQGTQHKIFPMITFGAKAYHLSNNRENSFKALVAAKIKSLPKRAKLFITFGEIDCRHNEGIISAIQKNRGSLHEITKNTVLGYLDWLRRELNEKDCDVFVFNVPAPIYNRSISKYHNERVSEIIQTFNDTLSSNVDAYNFSIIDTHTPTKSGSFSNKKFHVDSYHLSPRFLPEIQKQVTAHYNK